MAGTSGTTPMISDGRVPFGPKAKRIGWPMATAGEAYPRSRTAVWLRTTGGGGPTGPVAGGGPGGCGAMASPAWLRANRRPASGLMS